MYRLLTSIKRLNNPSAMYIIVLAFKGAQNSCRLCYISAQKYSIEKCVFSILIN